MKITEVNTMKTTTRYAKKKTVSTKDIEGTKVLSKGGEKIGTVKAVHVSPRLLLFEGVEIDTGFIDVDHFISKEYIKRMSEDGVVLKIDPLTKIVGKKVFDARGKKIGKVKDVKRAAKTNKLVSLNVDRGVAKDDLVIANKMVDQIGENVMLKKSVKV